MELEAFKAGLVERARQYLTVESLFDLFTKKGADPMQLILHILPGHRHHLFDEPVGTLVGEWSEEVTRETPKKRWALGKFYARARARGKIKEHHFATAVPVWFQANDLPWTLTREWLAQNAWWKNETESTRSTLETLVLWLLESLPQVQAKMEGLGNPIQTLYRIGLTTETLVRMPPAWLTSCIMAIHQSPPIADPERFVVERFPPQVLVKCMGADQCWTFLDLVFDAIAAHEDPSRGLAVQPPPTPGQLDVMELDEELNKMFPTLTDEDFDEVHKP